MSESIIEHATTNARRTIVAVLGGALVVLFLTLVGGALFQSEHRRATKRLVDAYVNATEILLADERLTMSANMAVATGEQRWIDRFEATLPRIAEAIDKTEALASEEIAERLDIQTRASHARMIELAQEAFSAVLSGDEPAARKILDGALYQYHKQVRSEGTGALAQRMIAKMQADFSSVQLTALLATSAAIPLFFVGAMILWRRLNASFDRSEGDYVAAEARIKSLAMRDVLTGLANRLSLHESLHDAILRAENDGTKLALLMIDLDRFKPINDRHGHLIGDLVLKEVAKRMVRVVRKSEYCGRFGGDEFVALIEYESNDEIPRRVGSRLVDILAEPMAFDRVTVDIGASVGVAIYPKDAQAYDELMRKADTALYRAKEEGRGAVRVYDASMEELLESRAGLEQDLRAAVRSGSISPYFQPLVDLGTGNICGFEILSRWHHPERGEIPPSEFISVAESAGVIDNLTIGVLQKACLKARSLPGELPIAINVAPRQIQDERFVEKILAVLTKTAFSPRRLEVEVTENALVADVAAAKRVIGELKRYGIKVALDDFGTGYSSLCYLSELPFDRIKIDRSFIKTLRERSESAKIVNAIIGLGKSLGVPSIAEGVESAEDVALLREMGCPMAQGYYFSAAVPATELNGLVTRFAADGESRSVA
jgi:diguanylate cyclase (GGDEF)-like protein